METAGTIAADTPLVHPVARKVLTFYNILQKVYPDGKLKTKDKELDKTPLESKWTVNDAKRPF